VPVGDARRAGYCEADPVHAVQAIVSMLARPEEFPDLRWDYELHVLRWGIDPEDTIPEPWETDAERGTELDAAAYERVLGHLYGYNVHDWIAWFDARRRALNVHHKVYRRHGGTDETRNLVLLHSGCHKQLHAVESHGHA